MANRRVSIKKLLEWKNRIWFAGPSTVSDEFADKFPNQFDPISESAGPGTTIFITLTGDATLFESILPPPTAKIGDIWLCLTPQM